MMYSIFDRQFPTRWTRILGAAIVLAVALLALVNPAAAETSDTNQQRSCVYTDLMKEGANAWSNPDPARWTFTDDGIIGVTRSFPEIPTDDPDASSYLTSKRHFGGNKIEVETEIAFEKSRYLAVYLDYDPSSDTGIWMATGHPAQDTGLDGYENLATAYIKTVENGHLVVRATGQLDIRPGETLRMRWVKDGRDFSIWAGDRLIATYRLDRSYLAGPIHLRLMSAIIKIKSISICSDWVR